jgi:hypothetical protein
MSGLRTRLRGSPRMASRGIVGVGWSTCGVASCCCIAGAARAGCDGGVFGVKFRGVAEMSVLRTRLRGSPRMASRGIVGIGWSTCGVVRTGGGGVGNDVTRRSPFCCRCCFVPAGVAVSACVFFLAALSAACAAHQAILNLCASCTDILSLVAAADASIAVVRRVRISRLWCRSVKCRSPGLGDSPMLSFWSSFLMLSPTCPT